MDLKKKYYPIKNDSSYNNVQKISQIDNDSLLGLKKYKNYDFSLAQKDAMALEENSNLNFNIGSVKHAECFLCDRYSNYLNLNTSTEKPLKHNLVDDLLWKRYEHILGAKSYLSDNKPVNVYHKCEKLFSDYKSKNSFMNLRNDNNQLWSFKEHDLEFIYNGNNGFFSFSCVPEFFLLSCIFLFLSYGILMKLSKKKKFPDLKGHYFMITSLILLFYFFLNGLYAIEGDFLFNSYFIKTKDTCFISMILSFFGILVCGIMQFYNEKENLEHIEYYILILSSIFALSLIIQANEMISFFFLLELQSISSYILAGFNRKYRNTLQSGIKYFIIGGVSSIFVILGLIFFFQLSGSTSFEDIKLFFLLHDKLPNHSYIFSLGVFFFTLGLFGKLYIFPFHWWILDVYEGSPSTTTLFFATLPYYSLFYILYKFYFIIFSGNLNLYWFYFFVGCYGSMMVGSIGAILQKRLKRLIGYSSIGVIGYTLTLFLSPSVKIYQEGLGLLIPYSICLFLIFTFFFNGSFFYIKNRRVRRMSSIEDIPLLRGIQCNKFSKYIVAIGIYGILGLPPMPLFMQKLYLLNHLGIHENWYLSFFFILTSMVSGYYYLYIIKELFYHDVPYSKFKNGLIFSLSFNKLSSYLISFLFFLQFYFLFSHMSFYVFFEPDSNGYLFF